MILVSCTAMGTLLILTTTVDCGKPHYATPSMHRGRISSCAAAEEGVPVCRDPEETVDNYKQSVTRTPYPRNGLDAVKGSSPSMMMVMEKVDENQKDSDRKSRAWWLFGGGYPKRTRVEIKTSTVRRDTSSLSSSWSETIVTYLMKGCSPTEMPFNLPPCSARKVDVDGGGSKDGQLQQAVKSTVFSTTRVIYYLPPSTEDFYFSADSDLPSVLV